METTEQQSQQHGQEHRTFVIFVGDIQEKWEQSTVPAKSIISEAGFTEPDKFVLEALSDNGGKPVAEFNPSDIVTLGEKERKFFRVTPGGGGRS
jgi:hypothetical protein